MPSTSHRRLKSRKPAQRTDKAPPPVFAHFVSLRQPPRRGQHQRPGKAGSAVFREETALRERWDSRISE
ncbi:hypothetical protein EJI00_06715 [Variovorax sp. DXTD-1]|nr:hypothetical protein EJI00_06715 [Variovorax sp. DXTD-1]